MNPFRHSQGRAAPLPGFSRRSFSGPMVAAVIVLLFGASIVGYYLTDLERRRRRNRIIVAEVARELEMRPELLLAVAETESSFDDRARSSKGAIGIMQVMPPTAKEVAQRLKLASWDLQQPRDNVLIGGTYLKGLLRRYRGDLHLALAAYHAGAGRVTAWRRRGKGSSGREIVEQHAFPSTGKYVSRVLRAMRRYRES